MMTNTHEYAGFVLRIGLGAMFIAHGLLRAASQFQGGSDD
jgi:uncharacterized membrane protein YphA (DoxX/SURF4 family)